MTQRVLDRLWHHHRTNTLPKEGSVIKALANDIAQLPPDEQLKAQEILRDLTLAHTDHFREPFGKEKTVDDVAKHYGLGELNDEGRRFAERLADSIAHEEVQGALFERLGTDVQREEPVTMRDTIAAAVDAAGSNE